MQHHGSVSAQTYLPSGTRHYPTLMANLRLPKVASASCRELFCIGLLILFVVFSSAPTAAQSLIPYPTPVNFGSVPVGTTSTQALSLYNPNSQTLTVSGIQIQGISTQAGFLTTIGGIPPGGSGGTSPTSLLPGLTLPVAGTVFSNPFGILSVARYGFLTDTGHNMLLEYDSVLGTIGVVAGTGTASFSGDTGPAVSATLNGPTALARDGNLDIFIADTGNNRVRMITSPLSVFQPIISTVAGNGTPCTDPAAPCGTGGQAVNASLGTILGIAIDPRGYLYISDKDACRIWKVDLTVTPNPISTYIGDGKCEYKGDGGPASAAGLNHPTGLYVDELDTLFIADTGNNVVRRVDPVTGIITTFAGNTSTHYGGDFVPPTSTGLPGANAVTGNYKGDVFITCGDPTVGDSTIRKVDATTGLISTVAGTTAAGYNGDTLDALTQLSTPQGTAMDTAGNLLIVDSGNNLLRRVDFYTLNTAAEFVESDTCTGTALAQAGMCSVAVNLTPALGNIRTAQLVVNISGQNPLTVPIYGFGTFSYLRATAQNVVMPETSVGNTSAPQTVLFGNGGNMNVGSVSVSISGGASSAFAETDNCASWSGLRYTTCSASLTFTPSAGQTKTTATYSDTLQFQSDASNAPLSVNLSGIGVLQQAATLKWAAPSPMTYGTALGKSQLNATAIDPTTLASVPGTFTYSPAAPAVLTPGTVTLHVTFVPADPVAYQTVAGTQTLTVNPAPLTITTNSYSMLSTGTFPTFTGTITGLVNGDTLTATYGLSSPPSGPPYAPGVYAITATVNTTTPPGSYYTVTVSPGTLTIGTVTGIELVETMNSMSYSFGTTAVQVTITDSLSNPGTLVAGSTTTNYYLSPTNTAINKWMLIGGRTISSVAPGAPNTATTILTLPGNLGGTYYVLGCANAYQTVTETNSSYNCAYATGSVVILADLEVVPGSLSYTPTPLTTPGQTIQVMDTTANLGTAPATATSSTAFYLSTTGTNKWMYLGNRSVPALAPGASSTPAKATALTLPTSVHGNYYLLACANAYNTVAESNTGNNCQSVKITLP